MKQLHLYLQLTELKQSNIKSSSLQTSYRFDAPFTQLLSAHFFNSKFLPQNFFISSYHGQTFHNKPIYVW